MNDSKWQMSFTVNRQQQFKQQPKDEVSVWVYALYSDEKGDYIHKPIVECSGHEICQEWLYHMGLPIDQIEYDSCIYALYLFIFQAKSDWRSTTCCPSALS